MGTARVTARGKRPQQKVVILHVLVCRQNYPRAGSSRPRVKPRVAVEITIVGVAQTATTTAAVVALLIGVGGIKTNGLVPQLAVPPLTITIILLLVCVSGKIRSVYLKGKCLPSRRKMNVSPPIIRHFKKMPNFCVRRMYIIPDAAFKWRSEVQKRVATLHLWI
jgi:hypothetical protein